MNAKLKTKEPTDSPNGSLPSDVKAAGAPSRTVRLWQRRPLQAAVGALVALILAAVVGDNVLARQYTPDGAVRDYLGALQAGNASGAWTQIEVVAPADQSVASLVAQTDLNAALQAARPDIKSFDVTGVSYSGDAAATVNVAVRTSKGTRQLRFGVVRSGDRRYGLFPIWRVVAVPVVLRIALPAGIGGLAVDGTTVDVKPGISQVEVLPLAHQVTVKGTSILAEKSIPVDALFGGNQTVAYQPTLSDSGMAQVKSAVGGFFSSVCAHETSAGGSQSCPQLMRSAILSSGQWQVVGDPASSLSIAMDPNDQTLRAVGRFQMVFGYQEDGVAGTRHEPDGSGYSARLVLSSSDVKVDHIARNDQAPSSERPSGATDQAALAQVAAAFAHCAGVSAETVADCPQAAPDAGIGNVRWSLQGDPTAGATVAYDGASGVLDVHGNFAMGVSYTWFGQSKSRSSYITHYHAYLFWDGQTLQVVTISGSES